MPIAYVQEFDVEPGDRSTTNYDAVSAALDDAGPIVGGLVHTAGFTPDGKFRILDVFETEADLKKFQDEQLMPTVMRVLGDQVTSMPPPHEYTYELHGFMKT